jgi:hypothetical protein
MCNLEFYVRFNAFTFNSVDRKAFYCPINLLYTHANDQSITSQVVNQLIGSREGLHSTSNSNAIEKNLE